MLNSHGQWIDWHDEVLGDHGGYISSILNTITSIVHVTASFVGNAFRPEITTSGSATWASSTAVELASRTAADYATFPLNEYVPSGSVIGRVEVYVDPGAAIAAEASRMNLQVWRYTFAWGTPSVSPASVGSTVFANNTGNAQILAFTTAMTLNNQNEVFTLRINPSISGSVTPDVIVGLRVMYTKPWNA
jgi:hypothetical protein